MFQDESHFDVPVVIIMFNRPEHLRKVFEQVKKVKPKKLFVIADGPRKDDENDKIQCESCKKIIDGIDWKCDVEKNYSSVNLGCGRRPASGLDWVFSKVEEAIILEDDCVPNPSFFYFCKELLAKYKNDNRIVSISGDNFQNNQRKNDDYSYYFSIFTQNWGWATWRRVWQQYDFEIKLWPEFKEKRYLYDIFKEKNFAHKWEKLFQDVYEGKWNSAWDFQFMFLSFINNGMNIIPNVNLVANIGFGELATHTKNMDNLLSQSVKESYEVLFPLKHPNVIRRDYLADKNDMSVVYGYNFDSL